MKAKKKSAGTKHRIREKKKREERIGLAFVVTILIVIISVSGFFIHSLLSPPSQPETSSLSEPTAAIVDHLSLTYPNQTFIQTATNTLKQAGYTVDYTEGRKVTVEFYRNLPTHNYGLIILRVHSAVIVGTSCLGLFTSERYDQTRYVYDQLTDRLIGAAYSEEERERGIVYFGISPSFVRESMNGRFQNTTIVMMGCEGLAYTEMASAFIAKGARVYVGWSDSVSASHTDLATTRLLRHFFTEKQTLNEAVQKTNEDMGPDPTHGSLLMYYPLEAED